MLTSNNLKRSVIFWLGLGLLLMQSFVHADSEFTERIEWKKTPIQLKLKVGHERLVHFPASVKVGVPASLQPQLRTQSVNGTVYFLANAPFDATRVMVRTVDGGQIYLFDLSASKEGGQTNPVQVFVKKTGERESGQTNPSVDSNEAMAHYSYVTLTRFAAQQLYAPARLVQDRLGIVRVPVARDSVALLRGDSVDATPLVAWRADGLYVTAVKLTNRSEQSQTLDPRHLRGSWLTAVFQHNRLLASGSETDTTAVYLISARPFAASR
ncbi:TIGR03749 family integrating conjugative element protein [Solemya velum gill symbiont]|uniref:TIGR03749 family integrating conjugative element protein n=1 Tax=Solemya velum gill symbiont TaxID=2340 RepID=UPI0009CAC9A8|nr:TIGR03749 family integrating conjugative element protein [Solemya velum gill symbiont]OOZ45265.1 integrating conjugative element protein [Solemya velum gill symbiont]OOZ50915.1 integrating conjugative element protein [Solemya velum gill symbiont]OOZ53532.1 integrating conjugative element protein [Solemya velum gill symbiont]OOZ58392.1 integrating conjugative element protein [Solemya velum gill symbiont]OOZ60796.1 integrating conjugative element protein [Solemya velum gill symbiont]